MSADSTPADAAPTRLEGRVERRLLGAGTKSEHVGVVLVTDAGEVWKLRRIGGNPFRDPVLDALEGARVEIDGRAEGASWFFERWRVI
ncbi:MAG: hypothetical protein RLY71_3440 [Pseudomonadota bacterium]|jgi:hypothetical protein